MTAVFKDMAFQLKNGTTRPEYVGGIRCSLAETINW